ncbi:MAG: NAD+ synthase [Candidatus Zixiibacteriota bacterium]
MSNTFDPQKAITLIQSFLADKLAASGLDGYVVGVSGGLDSALSASLAVGAVGPGRVLGVIMPYRLSSPSSKNDALKLVGQLGIEHREVDITPMIDAYFAEIDASVKIRAGNKMARERMAVLFDIAHATNRLVLGTGNRTEICLGYTTLYGDSACSLNPVGELYKTEARILARRLNIPDSIIAKIPTADLWEGQTDEGEIGVPYVQIDAILRRIVDDGETSLAVLTKEGFKRDQIERIVSLLNRNAFKRALPPVASLGRRPVPDRIKLS